LELIRRSLDLVYHANVVQLYVDQGQRARVVCQAAQEAGIHPDFAGRIMTALGPVQAPPKHFTGSETWPVLQKEPVKVTCFGGLQIFYQGQDLGREIGLVGKPRELLAYFVTHRNQRLPLDRILEDVWPGSDPVRGQAVFHTTLYRLRRALTRVAGSGDYVRHESGEYQLEREQFQIDVDLFESYLIQAQTGTAKAAIKACEAAIALYTGPYLATLYCEWCEQKRRRLDADYLTALRMLVARYTASGEYHQAIAACERMLEVDPLLEQTHCDLMRLWHRLGNQAAVVRQYQTLTRLLTEELDTEPMPETRTLYTELVGGKSQVALVRIDGLSHS
jgi:two-component SAPR family response regulator